MKKNNELENRINEFYLYLEQRLENQNEIEKQIDLDTKIKSDKILFKKEKKPIPSTI
jgi:hypothetical protein